MKKPGNKTKKIIAFSILGISIAVAVVFILDASKNDGALLKLVKGGLDDYRFAFSSGKQYRDVVGGNNATERFIQNYGSQIALQNPNGPEGGTLTLPSQKKFDALLAQEVAAGIEYEPFDENKIRTVSDSNIPSYLASMRDSMALRKTDLMKSIFEFSQNGDNKPLLKYASESEAVESRLVSIPAPASWKSFHIDLINFERKRVAVVRSIASSNEDPVKGLAAMEELTNLNKTELELAQIFAEKIRGI